MKRHREGQATAFFKKKGGGGGDIVVKGTRVPIEFVEVNKMDIRS